MNYITFNDNFGLEFGIYGFSDGIEAIISAMVNTIAVPSQFNNETLESYEKWNYENYINSKINEGQKGIPSCKLANEYFLLKETKWSVEELKHVLDGKLIAEKLRTCHSYLAITMKLAGQNLAVVHSIINQTIIYLILVFSLRNPAL